MRVDCGGTWDLVPFALTRQSWEPATVNVALDLRVQVRLAPFLRGHVRIQVNEDEGYVFCYDDLSISGHLALPIAILAHFNVAGLDVRISSPVPAGSGLGGSGALAVTLVSALASAAGLVDFRPPMSRRHTAVLAHRLEDGLRLSMTGLQDQLAAAYGGANLWGWTYGRETTLFKRQSVIRSRDIDRASSSFLVAHTGSTRPSMVTSAKYVDSFLRGSSSKQWHAINALTHAFARALRDGAWVRAAHLLRQAQELRTEVLADEVLEKDQPFLQQATLHGCGAAFGGGNTGGCVWAVGEPRAISRLRAVWSVLAGTPECVGVGAARITATGLCSFVGRDESVTDQ